MTTNARQIIAIAALGVVGLSLALSGGYGIYKTRQREKVYKDHDSRVHVHNFLYQSEYGTLLQDYMHRFGDAFRYVRQYRSNQYNTPSAWYEEVMSPLWLLKDDQVATLLAAAIAQIHMPIDYAEIFGEAAMHYRLGQNRYVHNDELTKDALDDLVITNTKDDLETLVGYIRSTCKKHKDERSVAFIHKHEVLLKKILAGETIVSHDEETKAA